MERKRFTEQQIHDILKESEAGANSLELCRKYGISKNTVWGKQGMLGVCLLIYFQNVQII